MKLIRCIYHGVHSFSLSENTLLLLLLQETNVFERDAHASPIVSIYIYSSFIYLLSHLLLTLMLCTIRVDRLHTVLFERSKFCIGFCLI